MKFLVFFLIVFSSPLAYSTGNMEAGQAKSMLCAACHGPQGISFNPEWPHIAGQHSRYFIKQLQAFKAGKDRNAPTMAPIVATLNDQDMADLAAFYASLPRPVAKKTTQKQNRGEQLYRQGDYNSHVTACIACHGPDGSGNAQAGFPLLAGQSTAYTVLQLQAFKDGKRRTDLNAIMRDISERMTSADMLAVAQYIASLPKQ